MAKSHDFYLFLIIMSVFRHDSYEIIIDKHLMNSNKKTQDSLIMVSKTLTPGTNPRSSSSNRNIGKTSRCSCEDSALLLAGWSDLTFHP